MRPLAEAYWFQEGPGVRTRQFTSSGIKLLNVANIQRDGTLDLARTGRYLDAAEVAKKYAHFLLDAGDLVVASSGISFDRDGLLRTRGAFVERHHLPLCLNTSTIRFKAIEGVSELRFLRFWLDSRQFREQITRQVTGSAQQNFGPSHLKALQISLPPLAEQRRIAEVLERAEALRGKRRAALAQLDSLVQALFVELFGDPTSNPKGWPRRTLGELVLAIRNGVNARQRAEPDGWPITRIETISQGVIDPARVRWIEPDEALVGDFQLQPGDILFSHINSVDHIAKTALYTGQPERLIHGINLLRLRLDPSVVEPVWLLHLLKHPAVRTGFRTRCKQAVNQASLNQGDLRGLLTYLPPLPLQREFAARVAAIEKLRSAHQASLAALDALFSSLQHRAFHPHAHR